MTACVTEFARAKINLALHVLGRRPDGYHELDSIVAFADIGDRLVFEPADRFGIDATGPFAADLPRPTDNIIHRAYVAVADYARTHGVGVAPVHVRLEKNLPVASGLGGGSANAAATLRALFRLYRLAPHPALALELGADVPACFGQAACHMQGMGERITPLNGFQPLPAVLVNPRIAVSTAAIFRDLGLESGSAHRDAIADPGDMRGWRNDLTDAAVALVPSIATVIAALEDHNGAVAARMSGSGATCFGVFETKAYAREAAQSLSVANPTWWVRAAIIG